MYGLSIPFIIAVSLKPVVVSILCLSVTRMCKGLSLLAIPLFGVGT